MEAVQNLYLLQRNSAWTHIINISPYSKRNICNFMFTITVIPLMRIFEVHTYEKNGVQMYRPSSRKYEEKCFCKLYSPNY
jgi:hypothetical protein